MATPSQILKPNKVKSPVPFREDWKGLLTCHGENQESQGCFHRGCHLFLPSSAAHTRKLADEEYFPRFPLLCAHFAVSKVWNRDKKKKKNNEQGGLQRFHCERWVRVGGHWKEYRLLLEPRDKEAGCFLPERTDCNAGPRAVIARSGNRL